MFKSDEGQATWNRTAKNRKDIRRTEAKERNALRAKRSAEDQLKKLDFELGKSNGAVKERANLKKRIEERGHKK